jgi:cell division septation protein DedD
LRLGAVQIVIWLGLAVGAVVGAYFVGFFQGNYVGFESGRGASGVEVPKLAVTEPVPESDSDQVASAVYDKLHTTTSPLDSGGARNSAAGKKESAAVSEERAVSKIAQDIKLADEEKRLASDEAKLAALFADSKDASKKPLNDLAEPLPLDNDAERSPLDNTAERSPLDNTAERSPLKNDVFGDDVFGKDNSQDAAQAGGAPGADQAAGGVTVEPDLFDPEAVAAEPSNVRMLGAATESKGTDSKGAGAKDLGASRAEGTGGTAAAGSSSASLEKQKTLGAILEERVDSARGIPIPELAAEEHSVSPSRELVVRNEPTVEPTRAVKESAQVEVKQPTATPTRKATPAPEKKPTTAPEKKPTAAVLVKKVVPSGFFAQVAAPTKRADAELVARKLKASGFPVVVEEANVNGDSYYRVLVGPEENRVQADRLIQQLQSERYLSSVPFVRKVK